MMMKHFLTAIVSLTLLVLASSCSNDPDNSYSYSSDTYNRSTSNSSGSESLMSKATVDYTFHTGDNTLDITTSSTPYAGDARVSFTAKVNVTYNQTGGFYTFGTSTVTATGATVTGLSGRFDLYTGTLYMTYTVDGTYTVTSASCLTYPYAQTSMTDTAHSTSPWVQNQAVYNFDVNTTKNTATISIYYLTNAQNSSSYLTLQYSGAKVTPSATGYVITADSLSAVSGYTAYHLRKAQFNISSDWQSFNGSFQLNDRMVTAHGSLMSTLMK